MENFGERLKNYRRAKHLTQQDLADLLGVSNKTVSRWESGGYPDLGMLVPLARALGVTVDDLLDDEKPIRTLTKADWQNFLSFVFALGGGVLFFLLDLFMPIVLCYLAYLVCMVYGVYLQRHYCYRTRWFRIANGIMDLSVNITMSYRCVSALSALALTLPSLYDWEFLTNLFGWFHWYFGGVQILGFLLALAVTAVTLYLTNRDSFSFQQLRARQPCLRRPSAEELVPALCVIPLAVFWAVYRSTGLPLSLYKEQQLIYHILLAVLVLLCVLLSLRKRRRRGLLPAAMLLAGGSAMRQFCQPMVYRSDIKKFSIGSRALLEYAWDNPGFNFIYYAGSAALLLAAITLAALCIAVPLVGFRPKSAPKPEADPSSEPDESET